MSATTPDFEQVLTRGKAQWFTEFSHWEAIRDLVLGLTQNPEHPQTQRVVRFAEVKKLESHWLDRDEESMETLIGAHETDSAGGFHYLLVTDQREIVLEANQQVIVYDV